MEPTVQVEQGNLWKQPNRRLQPELPTLTLAAPANYDR